MWVYWESKGIKLSSVCVCVCVCVCVLRTSHAQSWAFSVSFPCYKKSSWLSNKIIIQKEERGFFHVSCFSLSKQVSKSKRKSGPTSDPVLQPPLKPVALCLWAAKRWRGISEKTCCNQRDQGLYEVNTTRNEHIPLAAADFFPCHYTIFCKWTFALYHNHPISQISFQQWKKPPTVFFLKILLFEEQFNTIDSSKMASCLIPPFVLLEIKWTIEIQNSLEKFLKSPHQFYEFQLQSEIS